jgi:capsular polysaccharide biosynthesis protein
MVLMIPVAAGLGGYYLEKNLGEKLGHKPTYAATAQVMAGDPSALVSDPASVQAAEALVHTYVDMTHGSAFLNDVAEAAKISASPQELADRLQASASDNSLLIDIRALAPTEKEAILLANTAGQTLAARGTLTSLGATADPAALQAELDDLSAKINAAGPQVETLTAQYAETGILDQTTRDALAQQLGIVRGNLRIWERRYRTVSDELARIEDIDKASQVAGLIAVLTFSGPAVSADLISKPSPLKSAGVGAAAGLLAAIGLVALSNYLDNRLRTGEDVVRVLGLPVLGVVRRKTHRFYQQLYLRLANLSADGSPRVLAMVGVSGHQKGAALGLAQACAASGASVVLVSNDRVKPKSKAADAAKANGLAPLLAQKNGDPRKWAQATAITGLSLLRYDLYHDGLPAPTLLPRLKQALSRLADTYDLVVVDAPSMIGDPTALVMGRASDAVLLVVEAGRTNDSQARGLLDGLNSAGGHVLGVVLKNGPRGDSGFSPPPSVAEAAMGPGSQGV